ncbi:MAG: protein kinase [Gemmataceae bacterium]|nr:protein kinase [Gemmataceae bacterium]
MAVLHTLSSLALRGLLKGAAETLGVLALREGADSVVNFLTRHFTDHSQRLTKALQLANERAWKTLEIALVGETFWERCQVLIAPREQQAFREQVRAFLDATPLAGLPSHGPEFRQQCLRELRGARKAGVLTAGALDPASLAGDFTRFVEPPQALEAERHALLRLGDDLKQAGYPTLAHFACPQPDQGPAILASAVSFFFRRQVEEDRELFQGLAFARLEQLTQTQDAGFRAVVNLLQEHGDRLEELLGEVRDVVVETHGDVLDIKAEVQQQGQQLRELGQAVLQALDQHRLAHREVRPGDSLSIRGDGERQLVHALVKRFRELPHDQQRRLPALLNGLGMLEVAAGDFDAARRDFQEVATLTVDPGARAAARHNAYQAALEQRDWTAALTALQEAVSLDPERYAPFPHGKYEAQRILGAGGFGVAFLCRHRNSGSRVVVKSLRLDGLARDVSELFREAQVLEELDHPAIIRLRDCDFADGEKKRPFLVMEFFDGLTLADHVAQHGPLSADDLVAVARPAAEALHAAHQRGILHRDVKPANLLVRRDGGAWRVKLIDFGLALKQSVLQGTPTSQATAIGSSVAGTLEYAAPEQMGRLPGVAVGPQSDVYGFGKTCCYALFKTVQPLRKHWKNVPELLADLLEHCLGETPQERPGTFDAILKRLTQTPVPDPPKPPEAKPKPDESPRAKFWKSPPASETRGELTVLAGHTDAVTCVGFSPDGRFAVSASRDMTVRVWDLGIGREHRCFVGHTKEVASVAFFGDGQRVLSGSRDTTVRVWNVTTGAEIASFDRRTNGCAALSPDSRLVLSGSLYDGMLRLWDVATGEEMRRFQGHTDFVEHIVFSPTGNGALSSGRDRTVRLWDLRNGRVLRRFDVARNLGVGLAFAPKQRHALFPASATGLESWDLSSGAQVAAFQGHAGPVTGVAISPDGCFALSGSADQSLRWWSINSGKEQACWQAHTGGVNSVAFSPDGKLALSGGEDKVLRVWKRPD